tara:strand:+ start:188 stop:1306 length:1119 start_codon:yes stop_codon:yes gene_type:complete
MIQWSRFNFIYISITVIALFIFSCSSQEYTTAKLAIQQSDWAKAKEWLPKAMAVEPDNPEIPIVYAIEVHARNGDWSKMQELLQKAISLDPNKKVEVKGLFKTVAEQVDIYIETYWAQEFNKGVEIFKKIQEEPENKQKYLNDAILYFTNATIIKPSDAQAYTTISKIYSDIGDSTNAIKYVYLSVEMDPNDFDANLTGAQIMEKFGLKGLEVLPFYRKAVEIKPSNSTAIRSLASVYYEIGEKGKSIEAFTTAIKNENDNKTKADLYFNLGIIYNQMGQYDESENAFEEAYYLNEEDYEAIVGMAETYLNLGDKYFSGSDNFEKNLEEASRWYRKAEKKIKYVKSIDLDNEIKYQRQLEVIRYKRDIADSN